MSAGAIRAAVPPASGPAAVVAVPAPGTRKAPDAHPTPQAQPAPGPQPAPDAGRSPDGARSPDVERAAGPVPAPPPQPPPGVARASGAEAASDAETASGVKTASGVEAGQRVDSVLTGLRWHARHLAAELPGPLRRIRLRGGDTVLEVEWHAAPPGTAPAATASPARPPTAAPPQGHAVRSPIVGTFYRAPEPGAAPFVAVGDLVRPGQVVGIVEAMKLMNEVTADRGGRVVEVLAADGHPVEYDQPLVALDPA